MRAAQFFGTVVGDVSWLFFGGLTIGDQDAG
ncbi:hypothetical protein SAMN05880593_15313 [Rhizobium sp. RU36D]|nr:hypothetical protein SAMN05880593_15313 [Rhizobium sp. RU36D]